MQLYSETELKQKALTARGSIHRLYLHWTGATYTQLFDSYHLNVRGNGMVYGPRVPLTDRLAHTWQRNTGAIGLTICCGYNATTENFGAYPPLLLQIEVLCRISALLLIGCGLTPSFETVRTHAEQADIDDYGPTTTCERWDLWMLNDKEPPGSGGSILRGKIAYYYNILK